jgi:hypothetical protein
MCAVNFIARFLKIENLFLENLGSRARCRAKVDGFAPETQHVNLCIVGDWEARECQRHICEIQGPSRFAPLLS